MLIQSMLDPIRHGASRVSHWGRQVAEVTGSAVRALGDAAGNVAGLAAEKTVQLGGDVLDLAGADRSAARVRDKASSVGGFVDEAVDAVTFHAGGAVAGIGTSIANMPENLATIATDPVGTLRNVGEVVRNPKLIKEYYSERIDDKGLAFTLAEAATDVLGPGKVLGLNKVVKLGSFSKIAEVGQMAEDVASVAQIAQADDGYLIAR